MGISVGEQYTDYSEQHQEAIRRLVKVIENNNLHFKQRKLREAAELALYQEKTQKKETLKQKKEYLEATRDLTPEEASKYGSALSMNFAVKIADFFEESQVLNICYAFDRLVLIKSLYQKKLNKLRHILDADKFRQLDAFRDVVKVVKDSTIPIKYAKMSQGCIALYDFFKSKNSLEKGQAAASLKSYCMMLMHNSGPGPNPSPRGDKTKRGLFSSSRVTGSFVMSLAENFTEGTDKLLGLYEKVLQDTFK